MIFVDTSAWYEVFGNGRSTEAVRRLIDGHHARLVTSDAVLAELWNMLHIRRGAYLATPICLQIVERFRLVETESEQRRRALAILTQWADQPFSYADALSFALMERHRIDTALSLDSHFRVYRYQRGRQQQAFTVLPA